MHACRSTLEDPTAKAEIVDLLGYLEGDQVGLIAFAGRATVLAPLTPDFGFLRLVLEGAGPHSVTRGGTRLEEPIRKAVEGFGPARDASRALLLITDGEDHDSFALDAAKAAAEAGVVIIAIGFGDEAGSEIYVTDPRSGARELLRDAEGRAVRSRLDGELLREIALATGGAYVPAGTGVLDLESIYRQHIERLMLGPLDPRGQTVRDESYQWAVLLGLACLVASVAVAGRASAVRAALALAVFAAAAQPRAAEPAPGASDATEAGEPAAPDAPADEAARESERGAPEDPRAVFNRGVGALEAGDAEQAIRELERARRDAAGDAELRFRAAYDLGFAHAQLAAQRESEAPEEALRALYTAADWLRDAVQQRPDHEDSRVNLDVVLRRALLLADQLAQREGGDLDAQLQQLATSQRELLGALAALAALQGAPDADPAAESEPTRRESRARAAEQRALLSDADRLAAAIDAQREAIASRPESERAPEDAMRAAQLEGVLHYLHRARERMGQARRQLRQAQPERALRRGSAALAELKRALDQLRDPASLLDALLRDAAETARWTELLADSRRELPARGAAREAPSWLNAEGLHEEQQYTAERSAELDARLRAALESEAAADGEQAALIDAVSHAQPLVASAAQAFSEAADALASDAPERAREPQRNGIAALAEAREWFVELRGLIELAYADERRIEQQLGDESEPARAARAEVLAALRALQQRNSGRAERLEREIEAAASAAATAAASAPGAAPAPDAQALEAERFDAAQRLLAEARASMDAVARALPSAERARWRDAHAASRSAVEQLDALRRLFFSIAEALREVAEQQLDLADETRDAEALGAAQPEALAARSAPLGERQRALAARAGELAGALAEQSDLAGGVVDAQPDSADTSRRLREAGEHVVLAQGEMESAAASLAHEPAQLAPGQQQQAAALAELERALALLVPPEAREPQTGEQDSEPQPGESGGGEAEPEPEQRAAEPGSADPAQLLQAVRDREAQRQRERERRASQSYETVERDW